MGAWTYLLFALVLQCNCTGASHYVYRRYPLDLNLDDNLISVGGRDYAYNVAVKSAGPGECVYAVILNRCLIIWW